MKKSQIFYSSTHREEIEKKLKKFLNEQTDFLSERTINSPRAVGDAIENVIAENLKSILGDLVGEYSSSFARRAMADLAFTDKEDFIMLLM